MASIEFVAPQLLVDDLSVSIAYYEQELGFRTEFVYEGFYAALSRGGATLHLKCAPKTVAESSKKQPELPNIKRDGDLHGISLNQPRLT